jgi:hypothetical protein
MARFELRRSPELERQLEARARAEGVSLNQATLHALQRGLGTERQPVRYRTLRQMIAQTRKVSTKPWREALEELDKTNPEDWK